MPEATRRRALLGLVPLSMIACATAGSTWFDQAKVAEDDEALAPHSHEVSQPPGGSRAEPGRFRTRVIGGNEPEEPLEPGMAPSAANGASRGPIVGRVLGTFRNTYYDFPVESDFSGDTVPLRDARCGVITEVPRGFHDALCVQGSGILRAGRTVSFAKRDCDCAEICPRTGEKICYEALDPLKFPWGRGALGTAITPLLTIAIDDAVVPMGTAVYIPEFEGLPMNVRKSAFHDGCFIAQDRGLRVKGEHVDVFTGYSAMTALWNQLVPTNHGVTVVLDSPRCARAQ